MKIKLADGSYVDSKEIEKVFDAALKADEEMRKNGAYKKEPRKLSPEEQAFQERISDNLFDWQDEDDDDNSSL